MIDKSRCDAELGRKVFAHLKSKGYLTMETGKFEDRETRIKELEQRFKQAIEIMGLDINDPQLRESPKRIAKVWVDDFMYGLDWDLFPKCTSFPEGMATVGSFVTLKNAPFISLCAHHFLNFLGIKGTNGNYDFGPGCTIAYIPKTKIIGLSKLPRLVKFLSARPSNQEELCNMIREALSFVLETEDVAVYMEGWHFCMVARGIESNGSTVTLSAGGKFLEDPMIRTEFLNEARKN